MPPKQDPRTRGAASRGEEPESESVDPHLVLSEATIALHKKFDFYTVTIQLERIMDEMQNCTDCQDPSD
ncbi:unnamed protein product [Lampetra planeri]